MQYILFLKGVNVGGRTLRMSEVRDCLQKSGFKNVRTVLQTGNVILDCAEPSADKLRSRIENLFTEVFHYPASLLVRTPDALRTALENCPFKKEHPDYHRYLVFTGQGATGLLTAGRATADNTIEALSEGTDCIYWRVKKGHTLNSAFGKQIAKIARKQVVTNRNLNTLEKILNKCAPSV